MGRSVIVCLLLLLSFGFLVIFSLVVLYVVDVRYWVLLVAGIFGEENVTLFDETTC